MFYLGGRRGWGAEDVVQERGEGGEIRMFVLLYKRGWMRMLYKRGRRRWGNEIVVQDWEERVGR
jgi:hypothetical protein